MIKNALNITRNDAGSGPGPDLQLAGTLEPDSGGHDFEQLYLSLRTKENRIYTDEELAILPKIRKTHTHYKEWVVRNHSFNNLKRYLKNKKRGLEILEIGCGNGWLSNQLSLHVNCQVIGLDINRAELQQASRVFRGNTECSFMYGDIFSGLLNHKKFDIIVFAASVQYFPSLKEIVNAALKLIKRGGEIHIIDTHFYKEMEVEEARRRSVSHFTAFGFPEMSAMYFHHSLKEMYNLQPVILYDPYSFRNRFFRSRAPFYRICIRNNK